MAAKKLKFEEAMQRLQEIVGKLESGEVSLEESMKLFEEGAKLSSQCYQLLDKSGTAGDPVGEDSPGRGGAG